MSGSGPLAGATPGQYPAGFYPGAAFVFVAGGELDATSIPTGEAWGAPTVTIATAFGASSILSGEAWGAPSLLAQLAPSFIGEEYPGGFYPADAGEPAVTGAISVTNGIPSGEAWGGPTLATSGALAASSIPSGEAWGGARVGGAALLVTLRQYPGGFYPGWAPTGVLLSLLGGAGSIPSGEAWGTPAILFGQTITGPASIPSGEAWGVPLVIQGLSSTFTSSVRARPVGIGCGVYEVMLYARGVRTATLAQVRASSVQWSRSLDRVSQAACVIDGIAKLSCCTELAAVRPRKHELGILRNGRRIWVGPVTAVDLDGDQLSVEASDLAWWLTKRFIHNDHSWPVDETSGLPLTDLAEMFNVIVGDAMSVDNSPGLVAAATACGVKGAREVLASEHTNAAQVIDELSSTGIDWTMVDAAMRAGGVAVPTTPVAVLDDTAFSRPPTISIADRGASRIGVAGSGAGVGLDPVYGEYGPGDASYAALVAEFGVTEELASVANIDDSPSAAAAARTRWDLLKAPVAVLDSGTLSPYAPITQDQLVAGAVVQVRLANLCIPLLSQYRLSTVSGEADADGERINVTFQPVGTVPGG